MPPIHAFSRFKISFPSFGRGFDSHRPLQQNKLLAYRIKPLRLLHLAPIEGKFLPLQREFRLCSEQSCLLMRFPSAVESRLLAPAQVPIADYNRDEMVRRERGQGGGSASRSSRLPRTPCEAAPIPQDRRGNPAAAGAPGRSTRIDC